MSSATRVTQGKECFRRGPGGMRPLRVAIVDEELPYPPNSGKRIRTLNLTLRLARRHRLAYLCHANVDRGEVREAEAFFRDHGIETVVVDRAVPKKSGPGFYARLALNLLSTRPYSVASHDSLALRAAIASYAATHPIDLWQCEWTPYAAALRVLPSARRIVVAHNIESTIWDRYYQTEPHAVRRWYVGRQWRKFERFERRAFADAEGVVTVSEQDATLAQERFDARRVTVVDNGVDTSYFQPTDAPRDPRRILFLGSLDWRPNQDAARILIERIFPVVLADEPTARLCIVGRNPPEWLARLAGAAKGIELHANVADVRPFLTICGAMAVPLRIGGGSRLKILEALACGLPVISTRVGAEGLCLEPGRDLTVVDGVEDMAAAIVRCIREPRRALAMAEQGRRVVLGRYDWDVLAVRLEEAWFRCLEDWGQPGRGREASR